MKLPLFVALCAAFLASQASAAENIQLKTPKDKLSYATGFNMGKNTKKQLDEVDQKIVMKGIQDSLSGAQLLLTTKETVEAEEKFQREKAARQQEENRILAEKNKKEGEAFLAKNAKKEGVITHPSGLQYKVITTGKGKKPAATDTVTVNYRGSMIDGTMFDDSDKHPVHPMFMPVSGPSIIAGWSEALQLMNVGSKWRLFIPPSLGYKDNRVGPVGPNSVLIFDVELLSIEKAQDAEEKKKN